jgi:hypothetical protein
MLTAAAALGMQRALTVLSESMQTGEVADRQDLLMSFEELHDVMGFEAIQDLERRFLAEEQLALKYGSGE